MNDELEVLLQKGDNELSFDNKGNLFINGKKVLVNEKIELRSFELIFLGIGAIGALLGGIGSVAGAFIALLKYLHSCN